MIRIVTSLLLLALVVSTPLLAQSPPERVVQDAINELRGLEKKEKGVKVGDKNGALRLLKRMKIVDLKLGGAKDKTHASWVDAKKRFDALNEALYAKMNEKPPQPGDDAPVDEYELGELDGEITTSFSKMKSLQVSDLKDAATVRKWRDMIAGFRKRLAAFPAGNQKVRPVKRNLDSMEATLDGGLRQLATNDKAAEVQARLDAITARYRRENMPPKLEEPLEPGFVKQWVAGIARRMDVELPRDVAAIQEIGKDPLVNKQKLSSALHWVGNDGKRVLQETLDAGFQLVNGGTVTSEGVADFILETNPDDRNHVANRLLKEGGFEHYMSELQTGLKRVATAVAFNEGLGNQAGPDRAAQKAKIERAIAHFEKCSEKALGELRFPKSRSDDKKLLEIAATVLEQKGIKGWKRMEVTYDVNDREKQQGSISHGTTSSTVTVYHYVWKEYNVHTAEKKGDKWFLWVNKLRRYSKGDDRTTLNKWILYDRFQSTRILEENIDK